MRDGGKEVDGRRWNEYEEVHLEKEGQAGGDLQKEGEKWEREKERGIGREAKCSEQCVCVHSEVAHSVSHTLGHTYCKPYTHCGCADILTLG